MGKPIVMSLISIMTVTLLAGCAATKEKMSDDGQTAIKQEPVTLKFYTMQNDNYAKGKEANFEDEIGRFIKQKFPYVTIEQVHKPNLEEFVAAGEIPDIILDSSINVRARYLEYGLAYNLEDAIKKNKFDLSRINPVLIEQVKAYAGDSKLYALPFTITNFITYYNKSLFDQFGVSYPKDGMSWDDVYDMTKKMTRTSEGVQYVGLAAHNGLMFRYNQLSADVLDATGLKEKVSASTEWQKLFQNFKRFYEIPGNPYTAVDDFPKGKQAMVVHVSEKLTLWPQQAQDLKWDVIAAPAFNEKPKVGLQPNTYSLYLMGASKHKDVAFQVIASLLSDEVQTYLSKKGYGTPLLNNEVQKVVGQSIAGLEGKNVYNSLYYNNYADAPKPRAPGVVVITGDSGSTFFENMLKNGEDINTALRKWGEDIDKKVTAAKEAKGK
ncbi:ABC transporter substrate-binding protein [Paenibacillus ginsengarvi]|uniref:Extracellular solute-binding protein n=1 Tax=Paenibacillus ginsengarvi TaxID=400777 RepID=A0A3B0AMT0_9BACL|nr:extracellular solute-binding protein [Paenibacillus ginsengarvi]RKN61938.1 extracellular solute-binding protein [Paenibacillus ginsengarvi]